ncbi:hypothetical protein OG462_30475 [Streptomyces sp. NBC_01077]|uniref:hypothetical protein n=1 Tax=Streptomyces sp. NBC_01077 TaxID=2903746 RepID=UPI00386620B8|nr:hypothetical protein OG462_30475 [Streptomyces sp. NBC_01077]
MTTESDRYFAELTDTLRAAGVPDEQIAATVEDLRGHLAETGTGPEEEFGPAAAFAGRLGGLAPLPGEPDEQAENWTWTADFFNDRRMLAVHGEQGWEVESLDAIGRFVCRRAPGAALRWEYRREVIKGGRRTKVLGELEPEGWELCGEWLVYGYFKRPKAASAGPEGGLETLPARPRGWLFLSGRGKAALVIWGLAVVLCLAAALSGLGLPGYVIALLSLGYAIGMTYTAKLEMDKGYVYADRKAARNDESA